MAADRERGPAVAHQLVGDQAEPARGEGHTGEQNRESHTVAHGVIIIIWPGC